MSERITGHSRCAACGQPVAIVGSDEGTQHYEALAEIALRFLYARASDLWDDEDIDHDSSLAMGMGTIRGHELAWVRDVLEDEPGAGTIPRRVLDTLDAADPIAPGSAAQSPRKVQRA